MNNHSPKILSVCTYDTGGGAARAAYRIHISQKLLGTNCRMFVKEKQTQDPDIIPLNSFIPSNPFYKAFDWTRTRCNNQLQHLRWNKYKNREHVILSDLRGTDLHGALNKIDYDILHLHWINNRFIPLKKLPHNKPIIWTLHDSWPFCGVCHYFLDCQRYQEECGKCSMLHSTDRNDLSHQIWQKKQSLYSNLNLHIVTPSHWLAKCAKKSSLFNQFPITVIPNSLDTDVFCPSEKGPSQHWANLRESTLGKKIILFGAYRATRDKIKGYDKLLDALQYISHKGITDKIALVVFGATSSDLKINTNIPIHYVGYVRNTEKLVALYNLADVMVVPSLTENLAFSSMESLSCQTPVVAFHIGGNSDMIEHKINGYLAKEKDPADLAEGILWCISNNEGNKLGIAGRKKVLDNFSMEVVGKQYQQLYTSVYNNYFVKTKSKKRNKKHI